MSDLIYKVGNEFAPYHPSASHVDPRHRDGWNACWIAASAEIERLTAERDELRAALVATMEIVQEDRAGFALANTWPDGSMEAGDDAILRRYDAVIAQADAALGVER